MSQLPPPLGLLLLVVALLLVEPSLSSSSPTSLSSSSLSLRREGQQGGELVRVVEYCLEEDDCDEMSFQCVDGQHCLFECDGANSCTRLALYCTGQSQCDLLCRGEQSCLAYEFHCYDTLGCSAYATGVMAAGSNLFDCINNTCIEYCSGPITCFGTRYDCLDDEDCQYSCSEHCLDSKDFFESFLFFPENFRLQYIASIIPRMAVEHFDLSNLLVLPVNSQVLLRTPITEADLPLFTSTLGQAYISEKTIFANEVYPTDEWEVELSRGGLLVLVNAGPSYSQYFYEKTFAVIASRMDGIDVGNVTVDSTTFTYSCVLTSDKVVVRDSTTVLVTIPNENAPESFNSIITNVFSALGSVPVEYIRPESVVSEDKLSFTNTLRYGSSIPCSPPQPFQGAWCVEGVWKAPRAVTLDRPELFGTGTDVVYEDDLTFTNTSVAVATLSETATIDESPVNITIAGCLTMDGVLRLEVEEGFKGGNLALLHYDCHKGEFAQVIVVTPTCEYEVIPEYRVTQMSAFILSYADGCAAGSASSGLRVGLPLATLPLAALLLILSSTWRLN
eukprot:TRINITY_DN569_c0_g1_i1.p1 TRINITY_DN569_c0_g1~~TRINITY_DN569_c0_g1_i1.p1  ORF type:complete len:612 (+),score=127.32 TRINITY_DN569_c0_g1_i1:159-1838(+)